MTTKWCRVFVRAGERSLAAVALGVAAWAGAGEATEQPKIELQVTAEREVRIRVGDRAEIRRVPAKEAGKYEVVIYTIAYRNPGPGPIRDPALVGEIPTGTVFLPDSVEAAGAAVTYSVDGGKTYVAPPVLVTRKKADGTAEQVPAPPEAYSHIRWSFTQVLAPAGAGSVSYKVRVK